MNRSNAAGVSESTDLAALAGGSVPETEPGAQHRAIVYVWRPAPGRLAAAMERAFSFRYRILKRVLDIVLSLVLLVALLPLGLLVALLVALTSPGPIFYCEERVGRFRVPFRIFKFRSMYVSRYAPGHASGRRPRPMPKIYDIRKGQHESGADRARKRLDDPRITPVGRLLRRMSLDELPQLWNVLTGDMSLVGPRPIVEAERRFYGRNLPYYDLFCPGLTGLWQVSGRSEVDYDRRVSFDCEYASQWSCLLDLAILMRTFPAVVTMRGAY
jgi:lipopolysaccharide/colanic/teichoic acid biosynthesis glycosyltransferase